MTSKIFAIQDLIGFQRIKQENNWILNRKVFPTQAFKRLGRKISVQNDGRKVEFGITDK